MNKKTAEQWLKENGMRIVSDSPKSVTDTGYMHTPEIIKAMQDFSDEQNRELREENIALKVMKETIQKALTKYNAK